MVCREGEWDEAGARPRKALNSVLGHLEGDGVHRRVLSREMTGSQVI